MKAKTKKVKPLKWEIAENSAISGTPFGDFAISWDGNGQPCFSINYTPWGVWTSGNGFTTLKGGINVAEMVYIGRIYQCLTLSGDVAPLVWTELTDPTFAIKYPHAIAESALGQFLITWKGWKSHPSYHVDRTPWGEEIPYCVTFDDAKQKATALFIERVIACLVSEPLQQPAQASELPI